KREYRLAVETAGKYSHQLEQRLEVAIASRNTFAAQRDQALQERDCAIERSSEALASVARAKSSVARAESRTALVQLKLEDHKRAAALDKFTNWALRKRTLIK